MSNRCDYAELAHMRARPHGPAVMNRRGYNICQNCADAMDEAERQWEAAYAAISEKHMIDQYSRELQRRCFL